MPAVLLAATVGVTASLVQAQRAEDARALAVRAAERAARTEVQSELQLVLRTGTGIARRDRGSPRPEVPARARVLVEVLNTGTSTVRVLSAALTPGTWLVDVAGPDVVRPGGGLVLVLHREVDCSSAVPPGPAPDQLVLTALLPDQSPASVAVDVAREQPAYDGRLDDALRDPGRACSAPSGPSAAPA